MSNFSKTCGNAGEASAGASGEQFLTRKALEPGFRARRHVGVVAAHRTNGGATSITFGYGHFASRRDLALMADIIERMKESGRR